MKSKTSVTIAKVASLAGVSTATAGRVLGGYGYSAKATRDRVLKAASHLDYRPNLLARGLITGRSRTIGVVAGDIQSPFYGTILRGISDVVEHRNIGLLITNSDENISKEISAIELLREKQVDGIIVSPCDTVDAAHLRETLNDIPIVLIDREVASMETDSVGVDNVDSTRAGIAELVAVGHRRIGIVAELESCHWGDVESFIAMATSNDKLPAGLYPSWQRLLGYVTALADAGLPIDPALIGRVGSYSVEAAKHQASVLLNLTDRPTALFTADGMMSVGAMAAINSLGLQVPEELSLICFDDLDWMDFIKPGVSAIAQPRREMGTKAVHMLLERIDGLDVPPRRIMLATRHIRRGSIKSPSGVTAFL